MSPRSKKTSERMRAESRAKILAAARHLFAVNGYFQCKVSDIAQEAGMSQGNIYWYFASKEEILKAVLEEGFAAVERVLVEAQAYPGTGIERLTHAVQKYIAFGKEGIDFFTIFLSLFSLGGEAFLEALGIDTSQIGLGYHQRLVPILAQAQSEGSIAAIDLDILTMLFFGLFNGLIITYGDAWTALPHKLIQDAVLRLVGYTLPTE